MKIQKKKVKLRPRFYSMFLTMAIIISTVYLLWYSNRNQLPNLHGWASIDVVTLARTHDIEVTFKFVYSDTVAPTRVTSQSVQPGTLMADDMVVTVEISKGIKVK